MRVKKINIKISRSNIGIRRQYSGGGDEISSKWNGLLECRRMEIFRNLPKSSACAAEKIEVKWRNTW